MNPVVDGIGKENPGKIEARRIPQNSEEGAAAIEKAGFQKMHGLVIEDASGRTVFQFDGHNIPPEQVRAEAAKVIR